MKTLLSIAFSIIVSFSFAQWIQQTSGTTETLRSVCFTDTLNGWVAGTSGIILHTNDGGNTWEEQTIDTNNSLYGICFIDTLNGWTVGRSIGYPSFGVIHKTTDGGKTWLQAGDLETINTKTGIYFTDTLNGWAVSGIVHTSDGGKSWETQFPFGVSYGVGDIYFIDSLNGWIAGSTANGSTGLIHSSILHTTDGGDTWDFQFDINSLSAPKLFSVYFTDSLKGWSAGGYPYLYEIILKTTDGGNNWDTAYISESGTLYSVYFADAYNGLAVGVYGTVLYTSDGGYNWESESSGTNTSLRDVHFAENGYSWAVGDGGTILKADYSQIVGRNEFNIQENKIEIRCSPNPFTTSTTIEYEITQPETVKIIFYNQFGKQVEVIEENQTRGLNKIVWTTENLANGIYYFKLQAGEQVATGKVVMMN